MENKDFQTTSMGVQTPQETVGVIIKMGNVNFVVKERFAECGRDIHEVLEYLIVERCKRTA